jgi:hypothetical protein
VLQAFSTVPYNLLGAYEWACVRLAGLHSMITMAHADPLIVKTHNCNLNVGEVPIIPDGLSGPSVYLVRDPRDVAVSLAHHQVIDYDAAIQRMLEPMAGSLPGNGPRETVHEIRSSWDRHVRSWVKDYCITVRYEDLLRNPHQEFTRILEQYGIEYDQEKCERAITLSGFQGLRAAEEAAGFREGGVRGQTFFRNGKAGAWREELTEPQVKRIEHAFGEEMQRHGYE